MFLAPPGLNWNLALSQGHSFTSTGCLFSHILFLPHPLSELEGRSYCSPAFQCSSQSICFPPSNKISLFWGLSGFALPTQFLFAIICQLFFWILIHRLCHMFLSLLCTYPHHQLYSHYLSLSVSWPYCVQGPCFPILFSNSHQWSYSQFCHNRQLLNPNILFFH